MSIANASGNSRDRKSTRLNSSHGYISYAVFCLKKKKRRRRAAADRRSASRSRPVRDRPSAPPSPFFLILWPRDHRDLHSFPTRRSSDLAHDEEAGVVLDGATALMHCAGRTDRLHVDRQRVGKLPRSEEHTSELQSRLHLVCRLLLEKKKAPAPGGG